MRHPMGIADPVLTVIDDLQLQLYQTGKANSSVHRIRVDIKKLRAWIRLIRKSNEKQFWREIDHDLRDLSRALSPWRDRKVMADTLRWLEQTAEESEVRNAARKLTLYVTAVENQQILIPVWPADGTRPLLEELKLKSMSVRSIARCRSGLQRTFRRASAAGKKAYSKHSVPEDLHRFRKWAKYLYYQTGFIQILHADHYEKLHQQLGRLEKRLGRIHDLVIVKRKLEELSPTPKWQEPVGLMSGLIDRKIERYINKTGRSYRKIFNQSPAGFVSEAE